MKIEQTISNHLASNTFIVFGETEAIIVDCGVEYGIVKEKLGGRKVAGILLTHGHYDHAYNVREYIEEFNTKVYTDIKAKETLSDVKLNYGETFVVDDFSNFVFLSGDGEIKVGEFIVKYYNCPGHSACLDAFQIEKDLFVGDCIFSGGIGRTDLSNSDKFSMYESLKKLSSLDYETCHSGHYEDSSYEKMNKNINIYIKFLGRNA